VRKFSNQILAEIKAFSELFSEFKEEKGLSRTAVLRNSSEYPSGEDFEPSVQFNSAA
jgi:hypothetical protein